MAKKEFLSFEGLQRLVDNINSLKANINSPIFKGEPTSPTPDINDKSTRIATTEYVNNIADELMSNYKNWFDTIARGIKSE